MDDHYWFFTSRLRHQISILGHTPLSLVRLCIDGWSLLFVYLMTLTPDIHTGAYSPLLDEIVFGQWYTDGWSLFVVYLMTLTSDIHTGAYSPLLDEILFGQWYEDGWLVLVVYLMTLISDLILGHIFPIFFEYPWDWDNGQLGFRLSTSKGLSMIDYIRTSIHGFVKIEIDHIRFHPRSIGGSFS